MAVFVLGAGATRGASFVDVMKNPCLPPLDSDFFTQLQRIQSAKHHETVDSVIRDTTELFGRNFAVTMEAVFTTLEHTMRMVRTTGERREFKYADLVRKRDNLTQAIAALFEESLCSGRDMLECEHHRRLVNYMVPADSIISFNYDCLVDHMLKKAGDNRWNPRYGYGLALRKKGALRGGYEWWTPSQPAAIKQTVHLYKLHGSLHFSENVRTSVLMLKQRPYTRQHGLLRFAIIPPESYKRYDEGFFARLWRGAGDAIHAAETLVFIGYSMPETDQHSNAFFRTNIRKESLKSLVVVNPDRAARRRIRSVVRVGLTEGSRVHSFDTLAEFAACSRSLWEPRAAPPNAPPRLLPPPSVPSPAP